MVGVMVHRPWRPAHEQICVKRGIRHAEPQPSGKAWPDVANLVKLRPQPAFLQPVGIAFRLMTRLHVVKRLKDGLGGGHSRLHGGVRPLDLRNVQEAGSAADKAAAGEGQFRNGLEAAFIQRPRAIGNAPPAFEHVANGGMRLETLEFLEGREMRV